MALQKSWIGNETKEVDARPSDLLALAVRPNSPIYVAEEIMQREGKDIAAYEKEHQKISPGAGVQEILNEFDAMLKEKEKLRAQAASQQQEETKAPEE